MGLQVMDIFFLVVGIRDDLKQVESSATGNTSEPPDSLLKALTADHQGRFSEIETCGSMSLVSLTGSQSEAYGKRKIGELNAVWGPIPHLKACSQAVILAMKYSAERKMCPSNLDGQRSS